MEKKSDLNYWENYYASHKDPANCSPFAEFILPFLRIGNQLLELGCGNGRDSVYFASKQINVIAFDQCNNEVKHLQEKYGSQTLNFNPGDFTRIQKNVNPNYIYSRFTIHSIDLESEIRTLKWAYDNLKNNGLFFIEVRSTLDPLYGQGTQISKHEFVTDHYRRFLELETLIERAKGAGFKILYALQSTGLAVYKDEDPSVIRVVLQKQS